MEFNLIEKKWIPILRRDGTPEMIAPYEVTDRFFDNPVVSLNAPRPDFNGALIQFLIGLVQTVAAPQSSSEWRKKLDNPPTPEELKEKFAEVRHAFELGGNGPRFMQDFEDFKALGGNIGGLLIETPGENAVVNNKDHFVKRNHIESVCTVCCATALFTFQTNSPSGGPGYMTSLRGGGPLTTLVIGDRNHETLWQLVYLNILEHDKFNNICGNATLSRGKHMFPWLGETKRGKRKKGEEYYGEDTVPEDAHPATMYWAMPRRIRLNIDDLVSGACGVCGSASDNLINSYKELPGGASYDKWFHPLSPHYEKETKGVTSILPVHAQPGGLTYRHWLGFVIQDGNERKMPARIVHEFYGRWRSNWQFRLWAFGFDMDKMKARCWYESTMPLLCPGETILAKYEELVAGMIKAASEVLKNTVWAIKEAWFKRPGDAKGDTSFFDSAFWQETESDFYEILGSLVIAFRDNSEPQLHTNRWLTVLCSQSFRLFDKFAWDGPIEDVDPKRVVIARNKLAQYNRGKKIKGLLGIPIEPAKANKKTKGTKKAKQAEIAN